MKRLYPRELKVLLVTSLEFHSSRERSNLDEVHLAQGGCSKWMEGLYWIELYFWVVPFFSFWRWVYWSNTNYGIAFTIRKLEDGKPLSWMHYVEWGHKILMSFSANKPFLVYSSPRKLLKEIKIWHILYCIPLWTIWIVCNDKVFNQEQWHESEVNDLIWDDLILYATIAWERVFKWD